MLGGSGFGSIIAAPERRELLVYWHGTVPTAVQQVIDRRRTEVPIRVLPARYSRAQMLDAMDRITRDRDRASLPSGSVGPKPDASGLHLVLIGHPGDVATQTTSRLLACTGVVADVVDGGASPATYNCRQNDASPYSACARTERCTLGFAVQSDNVARMLIAGHCVADEGVSIWEDARYNGGHLAADRGAFGVTSTATRRSWMRDRPGWCGTAAT